MKKMSLLLFCNIKEANNLAKAHKKSYLRVGTSSRKKKIILSIVGIAVLIISLAVLNSKTTINFSWLKNIFTTIDFKYVNISQIFLLIAGGVAIFCFAKTKNILLLVTTLFYGIIYFISFGGINFMNSYWFWILLVIAEIIAIIASYIFTEDSFLTCCKGTLFQLFILVPVWFFMYCLCSSAAEKGNAELENLLYLILQFVTFTVALVYQLIMMFSDGSTSINEPDPVVDMTGDEDDSDYSDI